jgi:hypothetical protein
VEVTRPLIALKGDPVVSISVGTPYIDAGATLTDDISGAQSDLAAEDDSLVDVNTPGLYMVTYRATNANGFETVVQRPVAVTNVDASQDLSGTYTRAGFPDVHPVLTEVANGVYHNSNIGGSNGLVFEGFMAQLDESTLDVPPQIMTDGTILDGVDETLTVNGDTISYSYIVDNISFGTAVRVFEKP